MKRFLLGFVAFLSIGVALVAPTPWLAGLYVRAVNLPPLVDHLLERYEGLHLVFLVHVVGGGLALLTGPWQVIPRLRQRHPKLHRATGYLYVGAVGFAGVAGLVLGPQAFAGPIAQTGFTILAASWLATTTLGLRCILAGNRARHRAWMTRSLALALAAVSLRLQLPILGALGVPDVLAYQGMRTRRAIRA